MFLASPQWVFPILVTFEEGCLVTDQDLAVRVECNESCGGERVGIGDLEE